MKKQGNRSSAEGFTLIETLVGIVILAGVLLGPVTFLSTSFTRSNIAEEKLSALYLAEEGIELIRHIRENNVLAEVPWDQGLSTGSYEIDFDSGLTPYSSPGTKFLYDAATGAYSYNAGTQTSFIRQITISKPASDQMRIVSVVTWTDRQGISHSVQVEETMYNWL